MTNKCKKSIPEKQQQSLVEKFGLTRGFFREFGEAIIGLISIVIYVIVLSVIFVTSLLKDIVSTAVSAFRSFGAKVSKPQNPEEQQKPLVEKFGIIGRFFCEFGRFLCEFGKSIITIIVMVVYLVALPVVFAVSWLKAVVDKAVSWLKSVVNKVVSACKSFGAKKPDAAVDASTTPVAKGGLTSHQSTQTSAVDASSEDKPTANSNPAKGAGPGVSNT